MKILVTGAGGRIGGALVDHLSTLGHQVEGWGRAEVDLSDATRLRERLEAADFQLLINPAAMTNVNDCEVDEALAIAVNAAAPEVMAQVALARGAKFFHLSTDYVFDGRQEGLRVESDPTNPLSAYGRSKEAGEQRVLAVGADFTVIRTSWVFGPHRGSFLDSIIAAARENEQVEAIEDKFSAPCYSLDFARLLEPLIDGRAEAPGLLHLCNSGSCSWREYGQVAIDALGELGVDLKAREVRGIKMADMGNFSAERPVHTSLSTERYLSIVGVAPRKWQEAVREYVAEKFASGA